MRKSEVEIGRTYVAKVSGLMTKVQVVKVSVYGGWVAVNLRTGRLVQIRTGARLRPLDAPAFNQCPACGEEVGNGWCPREKVAIEDADGERRFQDAIYRVIKEGLS
jgi:hypothetical protein